MKNMILSVVLISTAIVTGCGEKKLYAHEIRTAADNECGAIEKIIPKQECLVSYYESNIENVRDDEMSQVQNRLKGIKTELKGNKQRKAWAQ